MDNHNQTELAMGQFAVFFCLPAFVAQSNAQTQATVTDNWIRGYVQFDLAPPHNEIDSGLCMGAPESRSPANAACSAFARFMASGHLEVRPFQKLPAPILKTIYVFGDPSFLFAPGEPCFPSPRDLSFALPTISYLVNLGRTVATPPTSAPTDRGGATILSGSESISDTTVAAGIATVRRSAL